MHTDISRPHLLHRWLARTVDQGYVDSATLISVVLNTMAGYAFRHALIRDAAYNNLLKGRRREIHLRVARTLEEHYPQRVASHPEVAENRGRLAIQRGPVVYCLEDVDNDSVGDLCDN